MQNAENAEKIVITLTEETISRMGSNSLLGMFLNLNKDKPLSGLKEVILRFPESSRQYCVEHDGPRWMMIPEYVIRCIIPDVVYLTQLGVEIKIETYPHPEG